MHCPSWLDKLDRNEPINLLQITAFPVGYVFMGISRSG